MNIYARFFFVGILLTHGANSKQMLNGCIAGGMLLSGLGVYKMAQFIKNYTKLLGISYKISKKPICWHHQLLSNHGESKTFKESVLLSADYDRYQPGYSAWRAVDLGDGQPYWPTAQDIQADCVQVAQLLCNDLNSGALIYNPENRHMVPTFINNGNNAVVLDHISCRQLQIIIGYELRALERDIKEVSAIVPELFDLLVRLTGMRQISDLGNLSADELLPCKQALFEQALISNSQQFFSLYPVWGYAECYNKAIDIFWALIMRYNRLFALKKIAALIDGGRA